MNAPALSLRLGDTLIAQGLIQASERDAALAFQAEKGGRIGAILVRLGAVSEESMTKGLAEQLGVDVVDAVRLTDVELAAGLQAWNFSAAWWLRQRALTWRDSTGGLHVAAVDVLASDLRETLEGEGGQASTWHFVLPTVYERVQHRLEQRGRANAQDLDEQALRALAEDAPVVTFVNNVMAQAVDARASDIHFEPGEREFNVKLRVDGVLHPLMSLPMARYPAIASRVKLVSNLDIAERRLPQDGRTSIRVAGAEMDIRVSSIPAVHGESLVMRLLPKERADLRLERLGMEADHLAAFKEWLHWPNGLVLVTGPTGSGKSTTLYSALAAVNDLSRKIVTVEDPVEYRLPNVVQIQTQADIGYTFARALRSILRHDPDIIMVGEIRDRETAEIAVQSALTGHLVIATVHTNDALSAVTRLVDMGIEPYLVGAALKATMAQRLVRRLCESCSVPETDSSWLAERVRHLEERTGTDAALGTVTRWKRVAGCAACGNTGFKGRVGIYELVTLTSAMQHLIAAGAPLSEVRGLADANGRLSLVDDGLRKTVQGVTVYEEVLRACGAVVPD